MKTQSMSRQQVREFDRQAIERLGLPGLVLMENAGRGCADVMRGEGIPGPVLICCGKGNNGGDGFVIARHLDLRGHQVRVLLCTTANQLTGDAAANFRALSPLGINVVQAADTASVDRFFDTIERPAWIVDALLGTGATGEPRSPFDRAIERMNSINALKLAVDIPSGMDCDTGAPSNTTFRADHTCTFVAKKDGFAAPSADSYLGKVHVLDIGVPRRLMFPK